MQDTEKKFFVNMSEDTRKNKNFLHETITEIFKFGECLLKFSSEFISSLSHVQT